MANVIFVLYLLIALKITGVFFYALLIAVKGSYDDMLRDDSEDVTEMPWGTHYS
jgi:hypothetical protein